MEFSRQEYWSWLTFQSPGDLLDTEIQPGSPTLLADSLPSEPLCYLLMLMKEDRLKKVCITYYFIYVLSGKDKTIGVKKSVVAWGLGEELITKEH